MTLRGVSGSGNTLELRVWTWRGEFPAWLMALGPPGDRSAGRGDGSVHRNVAGVAAGGKEGHENASHRRQVSCSRLRKPCASSWEARALPGVLAGAGRAVDSEPLLQPPPRPPCYVPARCRLGVVVLNWTL